MPQSTAASARTEVKLAFVGAALLALSCGSTEPAGPVPDAEESGFEFLSQSATAPPKPSTPIVKTAPPPAPSSTEPAPSPLEDAYAGCRGKMGTLLMAELGSPGTRVIDVTVEFSEPVEDDVFPGLGLVRPHMAVGQLDRKAIAKLCDHPKLHWVDAPPKSFKGG